MIAPGSSTHLAPLLASASVEISSRGHQLRELKENFAAGRDVTITFLPGDPYRRNVETAAALRRAGFNPVPHIAAREMASHAALDDFLSRLRGEADVVRALLIAGDVVSAHGPFKSSRDVAATGLLQAHGIAALSVAGHPEGHPYFDDAHALESLAGWRDFARESGMRINIVTQFCFESAPILGLLAQLDARGIGLPVIVGLAGPATPATLMKFALRCGVGNSIRALRGQVGRYGRLLTETGPDEVMRGLQAAPRPATAAISGFHLFPLGGLRKTGNWLRAHPHDDFVPPQASASAVQSNP